MYREKRFNSYLAGEIHIVDKRLIPNARRDDIEDSSLKDDLYNSLIRNIGIPYSKKIREVSRIRSERKKLIATDNILNKAKYLIENGYFAESQRLTTINFLKDMKSTRRADDISEATKLIEELTDSKHYLELNNGKVPKHLHDVYKNVFELIYKNMNNKPDAEKLINTICDDIIKSVS